MNSNEHTSRLADTLWKFKEEDVFCDTTICAAGGVEIYAHSVVLGAFSKHLRTKLQDSFSQSMHEQCSWNQSRKYRLDLTRFKPLLLNAALQFVYVGRTEQLEANGVHIESDDLKQLFEMLGISLLSALPNIVDGNHDGRDRSTEAEHIGMFEEGDVKHQKYEEEQVNINVEGNESGDSSNMKVPKTFTLKIPLPKHRDARSSFVEKAAISALHETKRKVVSTFTKHKEKNLSADVDCTSVTEGDACTLLDVKDAVIKVENEAESGSKLDSEVIVSPRITRQNSRTIRKCRTERQSPCKFQCCLCSHCFTHKTQLQDHLKTHTGSEPYACKLCEKAFTQGSVLSRHYLVHCGEDLQDLKNTEFEGLVEIGECQFGCDVSEKDFSRETQLKRLVTTRSTDKRFQCPKCDKSFQKRVHLLKHEMTHGEVGTNASVMSNKVSYSTAELTEHTATPAGIQSHVCNACGKQFDSRESLKRHESVHLARKIYHCQVCNKNFKCLSYLKSHQKGHDGIKPFMCDVCGKGFLGSSNLKTHRRIHTGERPYACSFCEKRFLQICAVKEHEKIHLGNKQFVCDTCGKMFMTYAQLYNHLKIHNGIKAFECDVCNKKFFTNGDLTKHQRIHKDQRPFVCKVCGKGFKYSSNLHGHARIHSGIRPYVCKTCGKDFTYSSHLSRHLKLHTREKIIAAEKECDYVPVAIPNHHIQATHISVPAIYIDRPNVDTNFTSGFTTYTGFNMHLCN